MSQDQLQLSKQHQALGSDELQSMFSVKHASSAFRRAIPRRIPFIRPFAHIPLADVNWMKIAAFNDAKLSEYNDCWTGEMSQRPIPFVSTDSKPLRTQEVFRRHIEAVLDYLCPNIQPAIQTINKVSSLGYPINCNPGSGTNAQGVKEYASKFDVVLDIFRILQTGDFSMFTDSYHTIGLRKQNESPDSKRDFQFISRSGKIFQQTISREQRIIDVPPLGAMIGSRSRTIVRPPVVNLWLQCWDTLLHNAIMQQPLHDANIYNTISWPSSTYFVTFDCKHYERYLGLCALTYANIIGGVYEEQALQLIHAPFIVPSNDWKQFFEIQPQYRQGVYPQYSSGLSSVAPLGKLTNICVQVEYFTKVKHQDERTAIATVFSGTSEGLRRWSYGDDNRVMGDKIEIENFCDFMSEYLEIERDDPPRYLGAIYRRDLCRWVLPRDTYVLKLYMPERDFEFKKFPNLGMVERRITFTKYGEPEIGAHIIPFEDELWTAIGHPFTEIATAAVGERLAAARAGVHFSKWLVTDKEYLMTEQEKAASGMYWHLKPEVTTGIVLSLVGDTMRKKLTFQTLPTAPIPEPEATFTPFIQRDAGDTDEETEQTETYA